MRTWRKVLRPLTGWGLSQRCWMPISVMRYQGTPNIFSVLFNPLDVYSKVGESFKAESSSRWFSLSGINLLCKSIFTVCIVAQLLPFSLSLGLPSHHFSCVCSWLSHPRSHEPLLVKVRRRFVGQALCAHKTVGDNLASERSSPVSWWGVKYQQLGFLFLSQLGRRRGMWSHFPPTLLLLFFFFFFKDNWECRKAAGWTNKGRRINISQ